MAHLYYNEEKIRGIFQHLEEKVRFAALKPLKENELSKNNLSRHLC